MNCLFLDFLQMRFFALFKLFVFIPLKLIMKKVSVRQSCFGPGLKKCVFRRVRFHPLQMFALVFWDHLLKFEANEAVIWWLEVFQIPKSQTLRTTPFVVIHSLSSGTPLNESMRLFQACFSRLNHTQSTVSKYASFWDFDLDEYQKLHLSNCIEKPGFSIFLVVFLLAFVPEKPSCVPIAGHPQLPHLFIPNSQAQETRHDFGGTIEGGTGPSPEDNFCEKWWISTFFWMELFGMNPWTLFFFSSFQLCSPDFFLEFLFCGMFWGLFFGGGPVYQLFITEGGCTALISQECGKCSLWRAVAEVT